MHAGRDRSERYGVRPVSIIINLTEYLLICPVVHDRIQGIVARRAWIPVVIDGRHDSHGLQMSNSLDDARRTQRGKRLTDAHLSEPIQGVQQLHHGRVVLVLEAHEGVLPGLRQRRGYVQFLVQIADLLCDVADLDLLLESLAVALNLQLLSLDDVQLLPQHLLLVVPDPPHHVDDVAVPLVDYTHQLLERLADHLDALVGARVQLVHLGGDDFGGRGQVAHAQARLVQQDLRHALDRNRERDDGVRARPSSVVRAALAVDAENGVASLTEHQLLTEVDRTLGDDVSSLLCHQVQ